MSAGSARTVMVGIPTLNRPQQLLRLLETLPHQRQVPGGRILYLVADNSPEAEWHWLVRAASARLGLGIVYVHEPARGLANVRNRILDEAIARGAQLLAFFDDDQTPHPELLLQLVAALDRHEAQVVLGAVRAAFEAGAPGWLVRGGFLDICRHADGAEIDYADTSNVILDVAFARQSRIRFDRRFNLSGGEDTLFFRELHLSGARIVFSSRPVIYEHVCARRATLGWLLRRWRWTGNTDARIRLILERPRPAVLMAGGLARIVLGAVSGILSLPAAAAGRFEATARFLRVASRGVGIVEAALGHVDEAYRRPDH